MAACYSQSHVLRAPRLEASHVHACVVSMYAENSDEVEPQLYAVAHALLHDVRSQARTCFCVGPRIGDLSFAEPATFVEKERLQSCGAHVPGHSIKPHLIWAQLGNGGLRQVHHNVRRDIGARIMNLVEKLLLDGLHINAATCVGCLGYDAGPVLRDLDNWIADVGKVGHVLESRISEIAAAHLRTALEKVSRHRGASQLIPVLRVPAEVCDSWTQRER